MGETSFTFVAAVEEARESIGAFEVEKGGDRQDEEETYQQSSQEKRGGHAGPSCSEDTNVKTTKQGHTRG